MPRRTKEFRWFVDKKHHCIRAGEVIKITPDIITLYAPTPKKSLEETTVDCQQWETINLPPFHVYSRTEEAVKLNGSPFDETWSIINERGMLIWDGKKARGGK